MQAEGERVEVTELDLPCAGGGLQEGNGGLDVSSEQHCKLRSFRVDVLMVPTSEVALDVPTELLVPTLLLGSLHEMVWTHSSPCSGLA